MSWDYSRYRKRCPKCKKVCVYEYGDNDWNQVDARGIQNCKVTTASSYELAKGRASYHIVCDCGEVID